MGEYEPDDSRDVTLKPGDEPGGIKRTGPREDEARRKAERRTEAPGNSLTEAGKTEQEQAQELPDPASDDGFEGQAADNPPGGEGKPIPGEISDNPARRAKADGERSLGKD